MTELAVEEQHTQISVSTVHVITPLVQYITKSESEFQ